MRTATRQSGGERRWIILGEDGRHVTMGRHSDPSPEELALRANKAETPTPRKFTLEGVR